MLEPVTMEKIQAWIKANEDRTWFFGANRPKFQVKYFDFTLDTRTMTVFRIVARQGGEGQGVHTSDEGQPNWNILDALEAKLGWSPTPSPRPEGASDGGDK